MINKDIIKLALVALIAFLPVSAVLADDACQAAKEDVDKGLGQLRGGNVSGAAESAGSALDNTRRCIEGKPSNRSENNDAK